MKISFNCFIFIVLLLWAMDNAHLISGDNNPGRLCEKSISRIPTILIFGKINIVGGAKNGICKGERLIDFGMTGKAHFLCLGLCTFRLPFYVLLFCHIQLGYDVNEEGKYIINEYEAGIVCLVFEMYVKGYGYKKIIDELNRLGYRTKKGNVFSSNSLHDILRNEKYNGIYIFNRSESKNNGKRNNHKNKDESDIIRIPKGMPRIIDEKLFYNVQAIMDSRKLPGERARQKAKVNYLLSGKVICGLCGSAMVGNSFNSPRPYSYYECNEKKRKHTCNCPRIKKETLEQLVLEVLQEKIFVNIPELIKRVNVLNKQRDQETINNINILKSRIKEIQNKTEHIIKAIESGAYSQALHDRMIKNEKLEQELTRNLDQEIRKQQASSISAELLFSMLEDARKKIFEYPDELETKNLVNKFINQVVFYDNEIQVSLNLILDTNGGGGGSRTPVRKNDQQGVSERSP